MHAIRDVRRSPPSITGSESVRRMRRIPINAATSVALRKQNNGRVPTLLLHSPPHHFANAATPVIQLIAMGTNSNPRSLSATSKPLSAVIGSALFIADTASAQSAMATMIAFVIMRERRPVSFMGKKQDPSDQTMSMPTRRKSIFRKEQ
jgi:hypothetical protein